MNGSTNPFLQGVIDEVGLNIELTELCALWTVEYRKGGWQKALGIVIPTVKKMCSLLSNRIVIPDEFILGATFAFLYDGHGNNSMIYVTSPKRRCFIVPRVQFCMEHIPTRENKKVFVVDYFQ